MCSFYNLQHFQLDRNWILIALSWFIYSNWGVCMKPLYFNIVIWPEAIFNLLNPDIKTLLLCLFKTVYHYLFCMNICVSILIKCLFVFFSFTVVYYKITFFFTVHVHINAKMHKRHRNLAFGLKIHQFILQCKSSPFYLNVGYKTCDSLALYLNITIEESKITRRIKKRSKQ